MAILKNISKYFFPDICGEIQNLESENKQLKARFNRIELELKRLTMKPIYGTGTATLNFNISRSPHAQRTHFPLQGKKSFLSYLEKLYRLQA